MPLWGKNRQSNNVPKFAADLVQSGSGNAAKVTKSQALFQNTTPNAYKNNETDSIEFYDEATLASMNPKPGGTPGWYLKRVGSGNRSSRTQYECVATVSGSFVPYSTNITASTTARARAGYAAMLAGTRNMNIAIMGDSTERGVDETASPYNTQYPSSVSEQLASLFRAKGIASGSNNWYGLSGTSLNDYVIRDSRITTGGTAAVGSSIVQGGGGMSMSSATAVMTFTPQQPCTKADIYTLDSSSFIGAQLGWSVDGGAVTNITQTGLQSIRKTTISLGTLGPHTIQIAWVSGANALYGIDCYDDTRKEVTFRQWGISGGTTSGMIDNTGNPTAGRLRQLSLYPVDLVIGDLGLINSWRNSRSIPNCVTDVNTLIDGVQAAGGDLIFCVPPFDNGSTGATASQQSYIDAIVAACIAKGCGILNVRQKWGSYSAAVAAGYMAGSDATHPRLAGYVDQAKIRSSAIRFSMGLSVNP